MAPSPVYHRAKTKDGERGGSYTAAPVAVRVLTLTQTQVWTVVCLRSLTSTNVSLCFWGVLKKIYYLFYSFLAVSDLS